MKNYVLLFFGLLLSAFGWAQQGGVINGKVTDEVGQPMPGATVTIRQSSASAVTDDDGKFSFSGVKPGRTTLVVSFVGFADMEQTVNVSETGDTEVNLQLTVRARVGDEIVVSASRRPEKITRAPATISVITARDFEQSSSFLPGEMIAKLQGVEFVRTGVNGVGINARGFNNAFNAKILQMTDGRNSMMAGGSGLPSGIMNTVIKEDIERLEVVLGPNSALYGPNAHNGIVNTITKDPRKYQGTTVVLGAGNQEVFSGRLRHAEKINNRWAYKITGEYTTGKDFEFRDSIYAGGGVYGPAVAIPERIPSFQFRHMRGEAHAYYSLNPKSDIILSYGGSDNNFLSVNNTGRNQIRGWKFSYLQLRFVSPRFFAQAYETWTNVGNSYGIPGYTRDYWNRTHSTITDKTDARYNAVGYLAPDDAEAFALRLGNRFKEQSRRFNAEAQYNYNFEKAGVFMVASTSYQKDNPKTFGTSLADAKQPIEVTQYGAALQLEKTLPADFKIVGAARIDHHSLFKNMFAPKIGIVKGINGGAFRLTYGKAFAAPIILFQRASVFGLVYGNGSGVRYIPNGAALNESSARVTQALKPEEIRTWEAGYKGTISKKLYMDINGYYSKSRNFLSPAISVLGRALSVGDIPVTPALAGAADANGNLAGGLFLTYFNYGDVTSYGVDLGTNYYFSDNVNFSVKYSWFGSDITEDNISNDANKDGFVSAEEKSLNAPRHRIASTLGFQNLANGRLFLNLSVRWVQQFDMYSGSQIGTEAGRGRRGRVTIDPGTNASTGLPRATTILKNFNHGPLGGFTTIDISGGYRLNEQLTINAGVSNLFNVEQREFVGSPSIGRLYSVELRANIPSPKK